MSEPTMTQCPRCGKPVEDRYWEDPADYPDSLYCYECFDIVCEEREAQAITLAEKPL